MLRIYPNNMYLVYPSWASFSYQWDQLPRLLADPLGTGLLDKALNWASYGYPMEIQPYELLSSQAGNGVIVAHTGGSRWLPDAVLSKEAELIAPDDIDRMAGRFDPPVYYLHPQTTDKVVLGIDPPQRRYLCKFGIEAMNCGPGELHWICVSKRDIAGADEELRNVATSFGLTLSATAAAPPLPDDAMAYLRHHGGILSCLRGHTEIDDVGFHLAAMYYAGFLMKSRHPRDFAYLCLVADVEGSPSTSTVLRRRGKTRTSNQ